jgi:hypothetical protein
MSGLSAGKCCLRCDARAARHRYDVRREPEAETKAHRSHHRRGDDASHQAAGSVSGGSIGCLRYAIEQVPVIGLRLGRERYSDRRAAEEDRVLDRRAGPQRDS